MSIGSKRRRRARRRAKALGLATPAVVETDAVPAEQPVTKNGEAAGFSVPSPSANGGLGVQIADPANGARDTRMIERAIKQRWEIRPELRKVIPDQLAKVVLESGASPRNKIAASRALLSADALNFEQEKRDAGGEQLNVNLNGNVDLTVEQRRAELTSIVDTLRKRAGVATAAGSAPERNGTGNGKPSGLSASGVAHD